MKPAPFTYHAPTSLSDAVALLTQHGDDAKVMAGGQSLVPLLSLRLAMISHIVDINNVPGLDTIEVKGDEVRISALVRQADAEHSEVIAQNTPLVAKALPNIGHFQIRNRGTVCGSIAHADPSSELPAVALTLDATMEVVGPNGSRDVAARDFFESIWTTTLQSDEILAAVRFPIWKGNCGHGISEVARRHGDFAMVGATASIEREGNAIKRASVALFGVGSTAIRVPSVETALVAGGMNTDVVAATRAAGAALDPTEDLHATADYRRRVAAVVMQRAIADALKETK